MQKLAQDWRAGRVAGTQLGRSFHLEGEILGNADVEIDGTVKGNIEVPGHRVAIGPDSHVEANLTADHAVVNGPIVGRVTAHRRIDLRSHARVDGDVKAPCIEIEDGAILNGKIDMSAAVAADPQAPTRPGPVKVEAPSTPAPEDSSAAS
jgi:cytoskeletal protein CcmA (bactofilin family)